MMRQLRRAEMCTCTLQGEARLVKTLGDAVMVVATSIQSLLRSALALMCMIEKEPRFPAVRAGLHGKSAVERAGDYFGGAVNLASRVCRVRQAREILCTAEFAAKAEQGWAVGFVPIGNVTLKNIPHAVALCKIAGWCRRPAMAGG